MGGLVAFGQFCAQEQLPGVLRRLDHLKPDRLTRYRMSDMVQLLLDENVAGESRVFGLEHLATDPLFEHLAGGEVPSIDTAYRDLDCFDDRAIEWLEDAMVSQGLKSLSGLRELHVDTTAVDLILSRRRS